MENDALNSSQQSALIRLLSVLADSEILAEELRTRLCEVTDFDPYETFRGLQSQWKRQFDVVTAVDVYQWLTTQQVSQVHLDEIVLMLGPYVNDHGEMLYDGFLRLVLPKADAWLRELTLRRGSEVLERSTRSLEVSFHLCRLVQNELEMHRRLKHYRAGLYGVDLHKVSVFLDRTSGFCAGMSGLVSIRAVRSLMERRGAFTQVQCDALLRRMNPSNACLASMTDLNRYLSPPLPLLLQPVQTTAFHPEATLRSSTSPPFANISSLCNSPASAEHPSIPARWAGDVLTESPIWHPPPLLSPRRERWTTPDRSQKWVGYSKSRGWSPDHASTQASSADLLRSPRPSPHVNSPLCAPVLRDPGLPQQPLHSVGRLVDTGNFSALQSEPPLMHQRSVSSPGIRSTISASKLGEALACPWCGNSGIGFMMKPCVCRFGQEAEANRWRTNQPPPQPIHDFGDLKATPDKVAKAALQALLTMAIGDLRLEDAKALLPASGTLEAIFDMLDLRRHGTLGDTDLYRFAEGFKTQTPFTGFVALIREVKLRNSRSLTLASPHRLSLRELGVAVLPLLSNELREVQNCGSDSEARSVLYLLRSSTACPGCGVRTQRDGDCAGCPSVRCPICFTTFQCFPVVSDWSMSRVESVGEAPLPVSSQYHVFRLLEIAAQVAVENDQARMELLTVPGGVDVSVLSRLFGRLASDSFGMSLNDLRRAFTTFGILVSEEELQVLWRRFTSSSVVTFSDFARQMKLSDF